MRHTYLLVALCTSSVLCISAQTPSPQPASQPSTDHAHKGPTLIPRTHEERERQYQAYHRIILNVRVADTSDKAVAGLSPDDFTLLDNQQPQKVNTLRAVSGSSPSAPTHVMLMLDEINNSSKMIEDDRKGIQKFLRQSHGPLTYPISIGMLTGDGILSVPPSRDPEILVGELKTFSGRHHKFDCSDEAPVDQMFLGVVMPSAPLTDLSLHALSCLNQRFQRSVSALQDFARHEVNVPGRLILVWIGTGWPILSNSKFNPDNLSLKRNFFYYLVELSNSLREAQITLDSVSPNNFFRAADVRGDHDNAFFNGVPSEQEVTAGSLALQALAHQSGGLNLEGSKDVAADIAICINDVEAYYVLSFDSASATKPIGEYHPLEVKVDKPGLTVRTNTLYYAQP